MYAFFVALIFLLTPSASSRVLSESVLLGISASPVNAVNTEEFLPHESTPPAVNINGFISITGFSNANFAQIWSDSDPATAYPQPFDTPRRQVPPPLQAVYAQVNDTLYPSFHYSGPNDPSQLGNYILSPSKCWHEPLDSPYDRCVILFAITEHQQNCVYNGLAMFLVHPGTMVFSKVWWQITNSYCGYYQWNNFGLADLSYSPIKGIVATVPAYDRMPVKSILDLPNAQPSWTLESNPFNYYPDHSDCSPANPYVYPLGFYGIVHNETLYAGISATRSGPHPYPEYVVYPFYSLTKSSYASVLAGVLKKDNASILDLKVTDYIPEADGTWVNTTLEHLLNMAENHYNSSVYGVDEGSLAENINFFYSYTDGQKTNFSLNEFTFHPETPLNTKFNYGTTKYYLAGKIIEAYIRLNYNLTSKQFFKLRVCDVIGLSNLFCDPLTTFDANQQPFFGYGMYAYRDDIAKVSDLWINNRNNVLDDDYYNAALNGAGGVATLRSSDPVSTCYPRASRAVPIPNQRYHLGFWSDDTMGAGYVNVTSPCENNNLSFMSGYSGIRIMIRKSKWAYVQWTDNYDFKTFRATVTAAVALGC